MSSIGKTSSKLNARDTVSANAASVAGVFVASRCPWSSILLLTGWIWGSSVGIGPGLAQTPPEIPAANRVYRPLSLTPGDLVKDALSDKDIPTGKGSFARDYLVSLQKGDQVAIDLTSENFDTVVTLMTLNGSTLGENDDGPDGGTNSLLFMRIPQSGSYIVRVQAFGQAKGGKFNLGLTRLEPARVR